MPDPPSDRAAEDRASPGADERLERAYEAGRAAALEGEEAAPGCTTTAEGRAFLAGYVEGARERPGRAGA